MLTGTRLKSDSSITTLLIIIAILMISPGILLAGDASQAGGVSFSDELSTVREPPPQIEKSKKTIDEESRELLTRATIATRNRLSDPHFQKLHELLKTAKGVLIFPGLLKGGFFLGGEGGNGVLLVRDEQGQWSGPAFFTLGSVSFGLQFGFEEAETLFAIMTDRGIDSIVRQNVKLGVDASVAVGPVGIGAEAATTIKLADLYSFSHAQGAFVGVSFEGAYIHSRKDMNHSIYGEDASAQQIVIERRFDSPLADPLRAALSSQTP